MHNDRPKDRHERKRQRRKRLVPVNQAYVSYDHPVHAQLEHALNIDFVNESIGIGARVAVELTRDSARTLVDSILSALDEADRYERR